MPIDNLLKDAGAYLDWLAIQNRCNYVLYTYKCGFLRLD